MTAITNMMSLWDALCPYLGLNEALKMTECTYELKRVMTNNMDMIVSNEKHHYLVRMAHAVSGTDNIDLKMLKEFKARTVARDMDILLRLHKLPIFYDNNNLQDLYMDHCIFFGTNCRDIDQHITSILTVYTDFLNSQESDKFAYSAFMTRLLAKFIKWVIINGFQDSPDVAIFNNGSFCLAFRSKIYHFLDCSHMVKDVKKRKEFEECINENKKYIIALVVKQYDPTVVKLFLEPNGRIYWMNEHKRVYL